MTTRTASAAVAAPAMAEDVSNTLPRGLLITIVMILSLLAGTYLWLRYPVQMQAAVIGAIVLAGIVYLAARYLSPSDETLAAMALPSTEVNRQIRDPWSN